MVNEFAVLMLLAAAGVSASWLLGIRNLWLSISMGLAAVTLLRVFTFSILNLFSQRSWLNPVFYAELFVILLIAAWRGSKLLYQSMWLGMGLAAISVVSTRVLQISTQPKADSIWILSLTRLFDDSGNLARLNRFTAIKRGFAYPLMLSLGEQHEFLSSFTPYAFLVLAITVIWAISALIKLQQKNRSLIIGLLLTAAFLTAVMPLRTMFYIGAHNLVAIAYLLAATSMALAIRDKKLSRQNLIVIAAAFALANTATAEAIVITLLMSLALISRKWMRSLDISIVIWSAVVPFTIWLATYNSYLLNYTGLTWWVALPLFWAIAMLPSFNWFDWLRVRSHVLVPVAFLLFLIVAQLVFPKRMSQGWVSLIQNLFGGSGDWGLVAYLVLIALGFVLLGFKQLSHEVRALVSLLLLAILGSLVAKIIGGGQLGDPSLGRFAWTDSLNRMWFNILGLALVTLTIGISQAEWLWNGQKSGKLDKAKS